MKFGQELGIDMVFQSRSKVDHLRTTIQYDYIEHICGHCAMPDLSLQKTLAIVSF